MSFQGGGGVLRVRRGFQMWGRTCCPGSSQGTRGCGGRGGAVSRCRVGGWDPGREGCFPSNAPAVAQHSRQRQRVQERQAVSQLAPSADHRPPASRPNGRGTLGTPDKHAMDPAIRQVLRDARKFTRVQLWPEAPPRLVPDVLSFRSTPAFPWNIDFSNASILTGW